MASDPINVGTARYSETGIAKRLLIDCETKRMILSQERHLVEVDRSFINPGVRLTDDNGESLREAAA
jgi:hypothetical protein